MALRSAVRWFPGPPPCADLRDGCKIREYTDVFVNENFYCLAAAASAAAPCIIPCSLTMTKDCDFLVIGAGVSGAAAAWELAALGSTILLEMEDQPGYHSSGRSAALYTPNYGPAPVRAICQAA